MLLMGRDSKTSPFPKQPSQNQVDAVEQNKTGGPTAQNFNLDVTGYRPRSRWNQNGALVLARLYVNTDTALTSDLRVVQEQVLRHIPALIKQYKTLNQDTSDPKVREKVEKNIERDARNSRRKVVRQLLPSLYLIARHLILTLSAR